MWSIPSEWLSFYLILFGGQVVFGMVLVFRHVEWDDDLSSMLIKAWTVSSALVITSAGISMVVTESINGAIQAVLSVYSWLRSCARDVRFVASLAKIIADDIAVAIQKRRKQDGSG